MTNPRQMCRQARKLHRHGIQPIVIIGGDADRPQSSELALLRICGATAPNSLPPFWLPCCFSSVGGCIPPTCAGGRSR
jgi:hypothetical protein